MKQLIPPNPIEKFLNIELISNNFIFINLWSFIHLISGGLIFIVLNKYYPDYNNVWIVLGILILYEIFEVMFYGTLFKEETFIDIIWDLVFGVSGYLIMRYMI